MSGPETERESHVLARRIADLMLEKAATEVLVLDLRGLSTACDFFVLCTGVSEPQVKAIADHVDEKMREVGQGPWHVEGRGQRRWILLDFVHVVAHVFHKEAREYYLLDRLWSDAPREEIAPKQNPARAGAARGREEEAPAAWDADEDGEGEDG